MGMLTLTCNKLESVRVHMQVHMMTWSKSTLYLCSQASDSLNTAAVGAENPTELIMVARSMDYVPQDLNQQLLNSGLALQLLHHQDQ